MPRNQPGIDPSDSANIGRKMPSAIAVAATRIIPSDIVNRLPAGPAGRLTGPSASACSARR